MMLNKIKYTQAVFLLVIFFFFQSIFVLAQQKNQEEKLIESFINEIKGIDTIPDTFVDKYFVLKEHKESMCKIKKGLKAIKNAYLAYNVNTKKAVFANLNFVNLEPSFKYYSLNLDTDHSLNFVVEYNKISFISLFEVSSHTTTILF